MGNLIHHERSNERSSHDPSELVNLLMERLKQIFPSMRSQLADKDYETGVIQQWAIALAENNLLKPDSIKRGLAKARLHNSPFLPSVGMFIEWCKPNYEDLGLPSEEEALKQALNAHLTKHEAVLHALSMVDSFELRSASGDVCRRIWKKAWGETIKFAENGGEFKKPLPKEMRIERKPMDREEALKRSRELVAMFGGENEE